MEIYLAIRHEVMFMREEDFPKKLEETNWGRRGLTLITSLGERRWGGGGGGEIKFC